MPDIQQMASAANKGLSLTAAVVLMLTGCRHEAKKAKRSWPVMGTIATVTTAGSDIERLDEFTAAAKSTFSVLEKTLSVFNHDSDISRLSDNAGGEFLTVSSDTARLLAEVRHYGRISHGAFDPTVAPLVRLWGFSGGTPPTEVPLASTISSMLAHVGYDRIVLGSEDGTRSTARLAFPGVAIDLGGIAKGYAVDVCHAALTAKGAKRVMVDLGGNIRCIGDPSGSRHWRIGVRDPFDRDVIIGALDVPGGMAVATSGNYERFVTINGKRFSHLIDPRTGYPVEGMAGVTVLAPTAVEADAMSTALFVLGPSEGSAVLEKAPGCLALFVPDERPIRILLSLGMKNLFTPTRQLSDSVAEVHHEIPPVRKDQS